MENQKRGKKIIAQNKKARHDYFIENVYEAGIELTGTEVKSLRAGRVNLKDSYCSIRNAEVFVLGMHISPYEQGNIFNVDPLRERRLLLHKQEINKLIGQTKQMGYSLIPLQIYFSGSYVKMELALAKGKKLHDKRDSAAERDAKRNIERVMKDRNNVV